MRSEKLYTVIEYLERTGFDADVQDLEDGMESVLARWQIDEVFSASEKKMLLDALYELASQNQMREIERMITHQMTYLEVI